MRNFKGIIMSMYTSKLTILRHFLKTLSMIHTPHEAPLGTDYGKTHSKCWQRHKDYFLCKK